MRFGARRINALCGLAGFVMLAAGVWALPRSVAYLKEHRDWVKGARARMRGATYAGDEGTVLQTRGNNCGAACLKMVLAAHGIERSLPDLTRELGTTPAGTSMLNLRLVATRLGLPARSWAIGHTDLKNLPLPSIAFIHGNHFVVIRRFAAPDVFEIDDPALGRLRWPVRSFRKQWSGQTLVFDLKWTPS